MKSHHDITRHDYHHFCTGLENDEKVSITDKIRMEHIDTKNSSEHKLQISSIRSIKIRSRKQDIFEKLQHPNSKVYIINYEFELSLSAAVENFFATTVLKASSFSCCSFTRSSRLTFSSMRFSS